MGKGNSSPSPSETAAAQGAANKETAIAQAGLNYVDQYSPLGSLTYKQVGTWSDGTPRYEATTSLTPQGDQLYKGQMDYSQGLIDLANQQVGNVSNNLSTPFSLDSIGVAAPTGDTQFLQSAGDAVYNQARSRLDPQWEESRRQLETKLVNQGITDPNSEAYRNAMANFERDKNDAYATAQNSATASASQAAQNLFGMQNTARSNALTEALTARELPLNEAATLMGNSGGVTMPTFSSLNTPTVAGNDVTSATNAYYTNKANANNAALGAVASLGGSLGSAFISDRRLKTSITRIGELMAGVGLYLYRYLWDGMETLHMGVMADEVKAVLPHLVQTGEDGFDSVDYAALGVV